MQSTIFVTLNLARRPGWLGTTAAPRARQKKRVAMLGASFLAVPKKEECFVFWELVESATMPNLLSPLARAPPQIILAYTCLVNTH